MTSIATRNDRAFQMVLGLVPVLLLSLCPSPSLAASITVDTTTDEDDGAVVAGGCSLREAVDSVNRDTDRGGCVATSLPYGNDTIVVPAGIYDLSGVAEQLIVDDNTTVGGRDLVIVGAGAQSTIVQAAATRAAATHRNFRIDSGSFSISGVQLRHGRPSSGGGGIRFASNSATNLTVTDCFFRDNGPTGSSSHGAALFLGAGSATVTISGSTFWDNDSPGAGGAIFDTGDNGNISIVNSTFFENTSKIHGGAISFQGSADTVITLNNVTMTGNTADLGGKSGGDGGAIQRIQGTIYVSNSVIAGNIDGSPSQIYPDCVTNDATKVVSHGHNVFGVADAGGCTGFVDAVNGDHVGTLAAPLDPELQSALMDNGGPTPTLASLPLGVVLDNGNPALPFDGALDGALRRCQATDQRGAARPVATTCDIGAVEGIGGGDCGDGNIDAGEECEAPFAPCCESFSCQISDVGTVCDDGSGDSCDPDEVCDGSSTTCPSDSITPAQTVCRTGSGDPCDPDEVCSGVADEACPNDVVTPVDTVCRAGSGDSCDLDEACSGNAGETCPPDAVTPVDTPCRAAVDDCDAVENCTGSAAQTCPADASAPQGTLCIADANECTDDSCDGAGACVTGNNSDPCNDGLFCTVDDACTGGVCTGAANGCDDSNVCTDDSCDEGGCIHQNNTASCDDGDACTQVDTCSGGDCVGGSPIDCQDADPCTLDSCDSGSGGCVNSSEPRTDCLSPGRARFLVYNPTDPAKKSRRMVFNWSWGDTTPLSFFGDPTTTTDFTLCVFDGIGGGQFVEATRLHVPAGPLWSATSRGYRLRDEAGASDGVNRVNLKTLISDRPLIVLRAGDCLGCAASAQANAPFPVRVAPDRTFDEDPMVAVQLVNETQDRCWLAEFDTSNPNNGSKFSARIK